MRKLFFFILKNLSKVLRVSKFVVPLHPLSPQNWGAGKKKEFFERFT
jgi:hypothetical protein